MRGKLGVVTIMGHIGTIEAKVKIGPNHPSCRMAHLACPRSLFNADFLVVLPLPYIE